MFYEIKPESTGRYWVKDMKSGRTFCVEPIRERNEKVDDVAFTNGGISGNEMKHKAQVKGGAVLEKDSIILPEKGFKSIHYGNNPMDIIQSLLKEDPNGPSVQEKLPL